MGVHMATGQSAGALSRILGFGFSVALAFGSTIGVGILRLPGEVVAALGDAHLTLFAWILGGAYALLGAVSVAELAAMMPTAGGFYVYARRAFGPAAGFVIGWNDWLLNSITVAYTAYTAADFLGKFDPTFIGHEQAVALVIVLVFTGIHWLGLRVGSSVQNAISVLVGVMLVLLAIAGFMATPAASSVASSMSIPPVTFTIGAIVVALRNVIVTYDGWYAAIYMAEETVDASRNVPRAMIACAALITVLYVLINAGFLHALPISVLAKSTLPAADVASLILPHGGAQFVTFVSLLTVLSLVNAIFLGTPRILYALGRDGLVPPQVTRVREGGTPHIALLSTAGAAILMIVSGSLQLLIAIAAVLFVLNYVSAYLAVFTLRRRERSAVRPFRVVGYPLSTLLVLAGSLAFLVATVGDDLRSAMAALGLIVLAVPIYLWSRRNSLR
jgi:basic amino acid/polyamine antiporter, APA family